MELYADWSLSLTNESASPLLMARAVRPLQLKLLTRMSNKIVSVVGGGGGGGAGK
jgi:hypothetical protein